MADKQKFLFIEFLKVIAIVLITNSHFKPIYEDSLCKLAFGGAMGCALFFFCSGFTLALSDCQNFWVWCKKRILRIYPAVLIFTFLVYRSTNLEDYLFAGRYWFIQAIIIFYVLFFFVKKYFSQYVIHLAVASFALSYVIFFTLSDTTKWVIDSQLEPNKVSWPYYFGIMLLGMYVRMHFSSIKTLKITSSLLTVIVGFVALYGSKFIGMNSENLRYVQLLFPLLLAMATFCFYAASLNVKNLYGGGIWLR